MINRRFWPSCLGVALLTILPLGPSHKLLAYQTGEFPSPGSFETLATLGTDAGLNQAQAAPAQAPTQIQPAAPQSPAEPADDPAAVPVQPATAPKHKENDRIFFALPNYLTVEHSSSLPPLTTGEKFKTVAEGCFDPVEVVFMGIEAGIGQADNTNPTYGQGFVGYSESASGGLCRRHRREIRDGRNIPVPSFGRTRVTTSWEKEISCTVSCMPPGAFLSRAQTRRENGSSISLSFSVVAWPLALPMPTTPVLIPLPATLVY